MNDIGDLSAKGLPSSLSLLKATAVAVVVAVLVLVFAILPAEYGVDPTGVGERIGLTAMSDVDAAEAADAELGELIEPTDADQGGAAPVSPLEAVSKAEQAFRTDEMSLTLQPSEGGEIKALMQVGEHMMFSWVSEGGAVNFDMHGEEINAGKDEFSSYWKGRNETSGHGLFQAPFAGTHGWYWRNRGTTPVTVRVKTSGYYEKLFRP